MVHWTSFWYLWQCGQVPSPVGKWNQHLHKACQQKEAWSALKCPGRWLHWLWTSENTVGQHQEMTWQPKSTLTVETSQHMDSVPLHSSSRLWDLDFQIKCKIYFHLKKRTLDHWATVQFFVSLAQERCFWRCFCFRSGFVALFLKTSERGDSWCTDSSFSSLLAKLSQVFESALLAHPCCLCTFSYPISSFQSTLNVKYFDTALLEQPLLSVMTLCDLLSLWGVSMIVFWTIAKSAVFPIIVVSKNKKYPQFILYGWTFIETQI